MPVVRQDSQYVSLRRSIASNAKIGTKVLPPCLCRIWTGVPLHFHNEKSCTQKDDKWMGTTFVIAFIRVFPGRPQPFAKFQGVCSSLGCLSLHLFLSVNTRISVEHQLTEKSSTPAVVKELKLFSHLYAVCLHALFHDDR